MNPALVQLYDEMSALTAPICAAGADECGAPFRCCERKYCDTAAENARKAGVELTPVNATVPFAGPNGCIVPPHLRPICTLHACTISHAAVSHIEHDPAKTAHYFELRRRIEAETPCPLR